MGMTVAATAADVSGWMLLLMVVVAPLLLPPRLLLASSSVTSRGGRLLTHSHLFLWIDKAQIRELVGPDLASDIPIISEGRVVPLIHFPGLSESMLIPPEVDSVNLTWKAGHENFKYWFENLTSLDPNLLYDPLLSIPSQGWIPHTQTVFQMSIPCTGQDEGVAALLLGLRIYSNKSGLALDGTPISFTLKKQCAAFDTSSLCHTQCKHGGTCTEVGECACRQGFTGKYCHIALCNPICENNGTCISPETCRCPEGFYGKHCEKALCGQPCANGGRCLLQGYCWCTKGFYGEACEYSQCKSAPCMNGGVCTGPGRCECPVSHTGDQCQHSVRTETERPRNTQRRRSTDKNRKRRRKRKDKRERIAEFEKRMGKTEKRILKIVSRKSRAWSLSKEERRVCRKLLRDSETRTLLLREKIWLSKTLTREKDNLKNKEKQKLRRYKKLIKMDRKRKSKRKPVVN